MDLKRAFSLVTSINILTEKEKLQLIDRASKSDPLILSMLTTLESTNDVKGFYKELRSRGILSTTVAYNVTYV